MTGIKIPFKVVHGLWPISSWIFEIVGFLFQQHKLYLANSSNCVESVSSFSLGKAHIVGDISFSCNVDKTVSLSSFNFQALLPTTCTVSPSTGPDAGNIWDKPVEYIAEPMNERNFDFVVGMTN